MKNTSKWKYHLAIRNSDSTIFLASLKKLLPSHEVFPNNINPKVVQIEQSRFTNMSLSHHTIICHVSGHNIVGDALVTNDSGHLESPRDGGRMPSSSSGPLPHCVTLRKLVNFSGLQCFHQQDASDNSIYLTGLYRSNKLCMQSNYMVPATERPLEVTLIILW